MSDDPESLRFVADAAAAFVGARHRWHEEAARSDTLPAVEFQRAYDDALDALVHAVRQLDGSGITGPGSEAEPTVSIDGVPYRQSRDDDPEDLFGDHGIVFVPVDPDGLPPHPVAEMLREAAARRTPVDVSPGALDRLKAKARDVIAAAAGRTPSFGHEWPSGAGHQDEDEHAAVARHVWRIRAAGHEVLRGVDWKAGGGRRLITATALAELKAALDSWDTDMVDAGHQDETAGQEDDHA